MSNLNQNEPDHDLEGLPPSVRRYVYEGLDRFSQIITVERKRLLNSILECREHNKLNTACDETSSADPITPEVTEFLIFSMDEVTFQRDFLDHDPILGFSIRLSFNPETQFLIVKMITPEHGQIGVAIHDAVHEAIVSMGLRNAIFSYDAVDIDVNGRKKQADVGWGPRRPPPGCPKKRPSVVVEIGVSETQGKLRRDINLWLDPNQGNAKVAFAVKLNRKRAIISIDRWMLDPATGRPIQSQHIEVSKDETDEFKLIGGPLIILFRHLFLRDPQTPQEKDVVIDREQLIEIAELGWEMQYM
ncbi:hypothetical protein N7533_003527 [Penicillium manginii]|uniref:uncharacterized protein n=1 Tax=Penicillium manginii TaxID=203109 RepID=UPI002548F01F|nr:uncharacterized protein N7533_003527 [Penicillium manginii]KAJ5761488.1 hypothetical protein N7533_003527 [Penicillium manginii]